MVTHGMSALSIVSDSSQIELVVKDNLEWWVKYKWQRVTRDGVRLKNELIHTVTGEHFYISAKDTQGLQPMELGDNWPFLGAILPSLSHASLMCLYIVIVMPV